MLGKLFGSRKCTTATAVAEANAQAAAADAVQRRSNAPYEGASAERVAFDAAVDEIAGATLRLKVMALQMGSAVESSNLQLDRISANTDYLHEGVKGVKKRTTKMLR